MGEITLRDIRLKEYSLETLELLRRLRNTNITARPEVCIERARLITKYYTEHPPAGESIELRYAQAVNHVLSNKEAFFFDDNLLAGTTTSKPFGAPVYPEFTGMTIWPELDTISTRAKNPLILSDSDRDELNFEIFPFWMDRNMLEYTRRKFGNPRSMRLFERIVFFLAGKAGCISHTVPGYRVILQKGIDGIIEAVNEKEALVQNEASASDELQRKTDFYKAVRIALEGIRSYAQSLSKKAQELAGKEADPFRKNNYLEMAEVCRHVPAKPARTFREAVNSLWLAQISVHAENINMAMSPGRLDQILYPYFRRDFDNGLLTLKEAVEIIGCLWLKLNDNTNLVPETAEELFGGAGTVPAVTVGGVDENGDDAVNDLTYIMLWVTELLNTRDPSLNARYHYERNPPKYRDRVVEVIANTRAVPAFHNDVIDIKTLENQGVKTEHARDYAVIGCVELAASGKSYDASSSIMLNLVSVLELTLYNGRRPVTGDEVISFESGDAAEFKSFEEFWEAFKKQLAWMIGHAVELNNLFGKSYQEVLPSPLLSAFYEGPVESGQDLIFGGALYNSSGATRIGFADTVDSLNAIEKAIFVERKCTFDDLIRALKANFQGYETLHTYLIRKAPKYGTDDPTAIKNSRNLIRFLYETYQANKNYRGGTYRPAYWSMTNHAGQGKLSGALPNGRMANRVFASGFTPASQAAADLSTCLRTIGELDSLCIPGGVALNLKYPSVDLTNPEEVRSFGAAVEAYFRYGGLHIQFNILSYETLIDAKKNPHNYPELLVRVSGYSAYFRDLNDAMKEEIITRTAYDLRSGQAIPFPEEYKAVLPFGKGGSSA